MKLYVVKNGEQYYFGAEGYDELHYTAQQFVAPRWTRLVAHAIVLLGVERGIEGLRVVRLKPRAK